MLRILGSQSPSCQLIHGWRFYPRRGKPRRLEATAQHPTPKSGVLLREKDIIIPAFSSEIVARRYFPQWGSKLQNKEYHSSQETDFIWNRGLVKLKPKGTLKINADFGINYKKAYRFKFTRENSGKIHLRGVLRSEQTLETNTTKESKVNWMTLWSSVLPGIVEDIRAVNLQWVNANNEVWYQ